MLHALIRFSIHNKLIISLVVATLIGFGLVSLRNLPIDAVPDITNNQVIIITTAPALGAADIERVITVPVEQNTRNIQGIIEQRSFSRLGLSIVTVVFDDNTDVYWARQQVAERLIQVRSQIPEGLGAPEMGPVTTGLGEIFQYVLRPLPGYEQSFGPTELRTIQDWTVRRQLLGTDGVADVSSFGGLVKQYEIRLNTDKLRSHNCSMSQVFSALERNNQNSGGAYIEKGPSVLSIRTEGLVTTPDDISGIRVTELPDGSPVLLRDVADVRFGNATRYGALCYNDGEEVSGGVVMMLKGANSSQVIHNVKTRIEEIRKSLPKGVTIEPFLDRTKLVDHTLSTVTTNLLEGAAIVIVILLLFLANLRAALLVASVIPLSMLFAVIMMNIFGVSGNLMSLGALDFGLIIDGSVIIVEAIMHRLHHNRTAHGIEEVTQEMMDDEVLHSTSRIMKSAIFGQLIILIVYLPFFTLQGIEGKMFIPMAQTVAFAIIGAFLLSLTYVPMMSSLVLSKKVGSRRSMADVMMDALQRFFEPKLRSALQHPIRLLVICAVVFVSAVVVFTTLGSEFIPKLEEGDFAVETRVLTGSSLPVTITASAQSSAILRKNFPEVEKVVTKIGSGEIPTDPMPLEAADMMVVLKPKSEWRSASNFNELAEKMSSLLASVPGVTTGFQFPVQMRFNELMTGARQDVVCKVFGDDLDTLVRIAHEIGVQVTKVHGAKDLYVESVTGLPQIVVRYDRQALARYGADVYDVNRCLEAAFAGAVAGKVYEGDRRFDLVIRLEKDQRTGPEDVRNLLIPCSNGEHVPLRMVADVNVAVGPNQIQREDARRRITVGFNVRDRDVQSTVDELESRIASSVTLPAEYSVRYGGQFENLIAAKKRLAIAVPIALFLIFVLLHLAFHSFKQGLLIYSAIPLAAIGGIVALWITGMPFSISAGVGFIALFGVAVLNGIVLITEFTLLKDSGVHDVESRVLKGTQIRLRPVLMTASVASFGFLPMALSTGAGAEVQRPLATVVIGGLITTTILTMLVLPVLYVLFERNPDFPGNIFGTLGRAMKRVFTRRKGDIDRATSSSVPMLLLIAIIAGAAFPSGNARAQSEMSIRAVLDTAFRNNLHLQAERLRVRMMQSRESSAWDIPRTVVNVEYGQLNAPPNDNRLSVLQSMDLPLSYARQRTLMEHETQISDLRRRTHQCDLRMSVMRSYYSLAILRRRAAVMQRQDSLLSVIAESVARRVQRGDVPAYELTIAQAEYARNRSELANIRGTLVEVQAELSGLMNSDRIVEPVAGVLTLDFEEQTLIRDALRRASAEEHPVVATKEQEVRAAEAAVDVSSAQYYPQLNLGYFNQSFVGVPLAGRPSELTTAADRFSSVLLGLNIALFRSATTARVESAQVQLRMAETEYRAGIVAAETERKRLLARLDRVEQRLGHFREMALPQSDTLASTARRRLESGEIGTIESFMMIRQSMGIEMEFLQALQEWNDALIDCVPYVSQYRQGQ